MPTPKMIEARDRYRLDRQADIFSGSARQTVGEAMDLTVQSLQAYGPSHRHWAVAWSGGKDSTATLTLLVSLIKGGDLPAPETLTVFYADTRAELTPLYISALSIMDRLRDHGVEVEVVRAPLDKRFLVYILGRGVPPPNNNTLRWCTRQIKVEPMQAALEARLGELDGDILMITGVRMGESAQRDGRIEASCSRDGAECGQGWYQQVLPEAKGIRGRVATLAPILHWRVCNVWDWLRVFAPMPKYGAWDTTMLAEAYGGDEAEEIHARTGCVCCPLAQKDTALDAVLAMGCWAYLAPLKRLRSVYRALREDRSRIRKVEPEILKNGRMGKNPQRKGPLTIAARKWALGEVLSIQSEINAAAAFLDRPSVDIMNAEEEARIRELIAAGTWPDKWDGSEPRADEPLKEIIGQNGLRQPVIDFGLSS